VVTGKARCGEPPLRNAYTIRRRRKAMSYQSNLRKCKTTALRNKEKGKKKEKKEKERGGAIKDLAQPTSQPIYPSRSTI